MNELQRRNSNNKRKGTACEKIIMNVLQSRGACQVQEIETGWRKVRKQVKGKWTELIIPKKKVAGDIRAVLPPDGRSILVEVKNRPEKLLYSNLESHQHQRLKEHDLFGAISLLAWIFTGGLSIMQYPIEGFNPCTSISIERAQGLDIPDLRKI